MLGVRSRPFYEGNRSDPKRSRIPRRTSSLQHGCFFSGRIVRQTQDEFRASNPEGSRGFESPSLRHTVWHVSLYFGEAMKSARGARFTRGAGPGECQRPRLRAKIAQNSLFAILACPSANRQTFCGEASSGRRPDASNYARVSLSGFQSLLLRGPERGQFDSLGHR